jgi:hypothetical protein
LKLKLQDVLKLAPPVFDPDHEGKVPSLLPGQVLRIGRADNERTRENDYK